MGFRLWALGFWLCGQSDNAKTRRRRVIPAQAGVEDRVAIQKSQDKTVAYLDTGPRSSRGQAFRQYDSLFGIVSILGQSVWALAFGMMILAVSAFAGQNIAIKNLNLPRLPEATLSRNLLPHRDAPLRIAALRVEFVGDTLSTTTGDGSFDYGENDSFYFDPPPHDSLYFADHIEFQNFYWDKMSAGNLGFTCDIFPAGSQAAYQLPKQMWQYNYNNGAAQLDKGLAELFRDAVQAADSDAAVVWNNYDLVIIFHAGAGAEFDLGFSSTPHDLPSAWMVKEDFRSQLNLPDGIPVENGTGFVSSGLILPETETHEGVQIGGAGGISLMIGHWLGLPALYDKDDGDPVVGKWSLMDRGFGNFYGALPGPVDVWSASYMGWTTIDEASSGANRIMARFHRYLENDIPPPRALRIPVSGQEEFILECRFRGSETDTVAYAWDRSGKRMTFNDDYSVAVEPGFRVPVRADNLDFDSPGSGILIWHHDGGFDRLIDKGRFNSVDEVRGLDLEEADGAQDIGRNYPFLTPGYGTDYGIYEDAWFGDNSAHKTANQGRQVSFSDDSYPNSRSNSGAFTHVKVDSISRRGSVMGFRYGKQKLLWRVALAETAGDVVIGNFDEDVETKEILQFGTDSLHIYSILGGQLSSIFLAGFSSSGSGRCVSRDLNGDMRNDVVWATQDELLALVSQLSNTWRLFKVDDIPDSSIMGDGSFLAIGGEGPTTTLLLTFPHEVRRYNADFELERRDLLFSEFELPPINLFRIGSASSDSFVVMTYLTETNLYLSTRSGLALLASDVAGEEDDIDPGPNDPCLADFDGSGLQDFFMDDGNDQAEFRLYPDILAIEPPRPIISHHNFDFSLRHPRDLNHDGRVDINGIRDVDHVWSKNWEVIAFAPNGTILEGFPQTQPALPKFRSKPDKLLASINLGESESLSIWRTHRTLRIGSPAPNSHRTYFAIDAQLSDGSELPGFPLEINAHSARLMELDTIPGYDLLLTTADGLEAYSLPTYGWPNQQIWWEGRFRDNDHSNAVWEPATPFAPARGAKLMPDDLCYNWPNPARGESTAIRYTLNFPATVSVEIFDIAGDKVASLSGPGEAGVPNEIIWNVKDVARGAYLAVVEATGAGKTERKTVKIAVVK